MQRLTRIIAPVEPGVDGWVDGAAGYVGLAVAGHRHAEIVEWVGATAPPRREQIELPSTKVREPRHVPDRVVERNAHRPIHLREGLAQAVVLGGVEQQMGERHAVFVAGLGQQLPR